ADLARRWCIGIVGQRDSVEPAHHVAAVWGRSDTYPDYAGRENLYCRFGASAGQRISFRHSSGTASFAGESIRGCESWVERADWTARYGAGCAAGSTDCDLCGAGDFVDGRAAWVGALVA